MKKIWMILIAVGFLFCANSGLAKEEAVDAGNKVCPVTGDRIDPGSNITYEYQGKSYNFCCPMCVPEFKKDPEKYIEIVNKEKARR